jgi:ribosomal-protein-alanine N-acetyltransferase
MMGNDSKTPLLRMVQSPRLNLIAATNDLIRKAIAGRDFLAKALAVGVPESWPPELYGPRAMHFSLMQLDGAAEQGWSFWYLVTDTDPGELVGICGFKGRPDESGVVEIGYSIVSGYRRQGFATEAVLRLVTWAFSHHNVHEVCAETFPHLTQSIGVLRKNGFQYIGVGSEAGVVRYAIKRSDLN